MGGDCLEENNSTENDTEKSSDETQTDQPATEKNDSAESLTGEDQSNASEQLDTNQPVTNTDPTVSTTNESLPLDLVPENPQLFSTSYITDDYVITLVHDITLGDFLIATLLCVLIVVQLLKALLGGGRW